MYRQGDIRLVPVNREESSKVFSGLVSSSRKEVYRDGKIILAEGETSGHYHGVSQETCEYQPVSWPTRSILEGTVIGTLEVKLETDLEHVGHHDPIAVAPGLYFVCQQREYSPTVHGRSMPVID